ncbi:MAG: carboxymuconolactone decarboxylase family protein [Planctomycetes bacterium]|nr:carboxymuconolactone decarboxylase family protein [Planctomycetota bacterium]
MSLSPAERRLARVFTSAVLGRFDVLAQLRRDAPPGEPDRSWREALLQVHVFAGFPRGVEAYAVLEAQGGLGLPDADEEDRAAVPELRARGEQLFRRIYEHDAPAVQAMLARQHPQFERWVLEHAYGRVLARAGLAPRMRELLAVCALASLGQERQLASHVRGALRCGGTRADLEEVLAEIADFIEPLEHLERAQRVVEHFGAG